MQIPDLSDQLILGHSGDRCSLLKISRLWFRLLISTASRAANRAYDKFLRIRGFDLERARAPVHLGKADNVNSANEFSDTHNLDANSVAGPSP